MNEEKLKFSFLKRTRGVISSVMLIHAYSLCLFFLNLFFNNHMESFFFISFFFVSPRFYIASVIPPPTRATKAVCNGNSRHGVKKERAGGLREKKWGRVNKNQGKYNHRSEETLFTGVFFLLSTSYSRVNICNYRTRPIRGFLFGQLAGRFFNFP